MIDAVRVLLAGLHVAAILVAGVVVASSVVIAMDTCRTRCDQWRERRRRARRPGYIYGGPR